jgi:hypothetical protein
MKRTEQEQETRAKSAGKEDYQMKLEQRRRIGLLTSGITYGFLWTDLSQWGDVLIWLERVAPKVLFWG